MLKDWVSAIVAARCVRTVLGSVPARAERARRFYCGSASLPDVQDCFRDTASPRVGQTFGSSKSSFSHFSAALTGTVASYGP